MKHKKQYRILGASLCGCVGGVCAFFTGGIVLALICSIGLGVYGYFLARLITQPSPKS